MIAHTVQLEEAYTNWAKRWRILRQYWRKTSLKYKLVKIRSFFIRLIESLRQLCKINNNFKLVLWRTLHNRERVSYRGVLFNAMRRATFHADRTSVRRRQSNTPFRFLQNYSVFYRFSDQNFALISPRDNTLRIRSAIIHRVKRPAWVNGWRATDLIRI